MWLPLRRVLGSVPGIRWLRRIRHERAFREGGGWRFWGVFPSHAEAAAAARREGRSTVGYDTPLVAGFGREIYGAIHGFDYPALLWLARFVGARGALDGNGGCRIVDLGGHLGDKARAYRELWPWLAGCTWTVCDTESVVEMAAQLGVHATTEGVEITADTLVLGGSDILFASGVIQYLEVDLHELLDAVEDPPAHMVINKIPLSDREDHWTVQNLGRTVVPYRILNRGRFLATLQERGYRIRDEWEVPHYYARIPFHPMHGTTVNSGLALSRE